MQLHWPQAVTLAVVLIATHVGSRAIGTDLATEVVWACVGGGAHVDAGRALHQAVVVVVGTGKAHIQAVARGP